MNPAPKERYQLKPSAKPLSKIVLAIDRLNLQMLDLIRLPQSLSLDELLAASVSVPRIIDL